MANSATGYVLYTMICTGKEGSMSGRDLVMPVVL